MKKRFFWWFYLLLVLLRLLTVVTVVPYPFLSWLAMYWLDMFDYGAALRSGITFETYEWIDKSVDVLNRFYLVYAGYALGGPAWILLVMVLFRLIGDVGLATTKNRIFLFLFPNLIEYFFPLYLVYLTYYQGRIDILVAFIIGSALVKIVHEYFLHVRDWVDPFSKAYLKNHREHRRRKLKTA